MAELTNGDVTITDIDIVRGLPAALKPRVDVWETPGLDGYGAQLLGLGDAKFDLTIIKYCQGTDGGSGEGSGSGSAGSHANSFIEDINSLQGTLVTLTDDWDDEYADLLAVHVDTTDAKKPCLFLGAPAVRVEIKIEMVTCALDDGGGSGSGG